jgi:hypothetical protein
MDTFNAICHINPVTFLRLIRQSDVTIIHAETKVRTFGQNCRSPNLLGGISFIFGAWPMLGGVIQRLLEVVGFAWLVYLDRGPFAARSE